MLQTLRMPEAARRASALLSLPADHAACLSGDVGATLQQQQRLTAAIRAGTAGLQLAKQPQASLHADAISSDLRLWATSNLTARTLTVTIFSKEGIVCRHTFADVLQACIEPKFNYENSRLGLAFAQPTASGRIYNLALIDLTQPDEQPTMVNCGSEAVHPTFSIAAAPSADVYLVSVHKYSELEKSWRDVLDLVSGTGSNLEQHLAPEGCQLPYDQQAFSPDSRYLCCTGVEQFSERRTNSTIGLHCLDVQNGAWHRLQQPVHEFYGWLQTPACSPRIIMKLGASLAMITFPHLATTLGNHAYAASVLQAGVLQGSCPGSCVLC